MAALVGMVLIGRHSDKTAERKLHVAACAITASIGLFMAIAFRGNLYMLVLAFTICQVGQRSVMSVFWTMPPMLLGGTAAAAGIALINAIGNLGGFFGPTMMGWLRDATGGYTRRPAGARLRAHPRGGAGGVAEAAARRSAPEP